MTEASIRDAILKAHDEGRLITCRIPYGGTIALALERHMVEQSMRAWKDEIPARDRERTLGSVLRAIKRTVKRLKQNRATREERDALAADVALWLAHEMLFSDGECHLIKGPTRSALMKPELSVGQRPDGLHKVGS